MEPLSTPTMRTHSCARIRRHSNSCTTTTAPGKVPRSHWPCTPARSSVGAAGMPNPAPVPSLVTCGTLSTRAISRRSFSDPDQSRKHTSPMNTSCSMSTRAASSTSSSSSGRGAISSRTRYDAAVWHRRLQITTTAVLRQMKRDRFPPPPGRSRPACGASVPGRLCAPALSDPDVPADCPARRGRGGISDGVRDPRGTCRSPTW